MDRFRSISGRAPDILDQLKGPRIEYADVFVQSTRYHSARIRDSGDSGWRSRPPRPERRATESAGMGLRVLCGEKVGFTATTDLSDEGIEDALLSPHLDPSFNPNAGSTPRPTRLDATDDELVQLARELVDVCRSSAETVESIDVSITRVLDRRTVASTESPVKTGSETRIEVRAEIVAGGNEIVVTEAAPDRPDSAPEIVRAASKRILRAASIETDGRIGVGAGERLPVLLPPGFGAVWMHEAVGHQLEADSRLDGRSELTDELGAVIAGPEVTVVDDPMASGGRVCRPFDDEGVDAAETVLIDRGRLVGLLTDRIHARRLGLRPSGNGRRPHFGVLPRPRMTNLLLRSAGSTREALLTERPRVLVVTEIRRAWYHPATRTVHMLVKSGQIVEGGHIVGGTTPLVLTAEPRAILTGIRGVADDFSLDPSRGYCKKDGLAMAVGLGQPSVLIDSIKVEGASKYFR